jgi:Family of unknown function (DUF6221)
MPEFDAWLSDAHAAMLEALDAVIDTEGSLLRVKEAAERGLEREYVEATSSGPGAPYPEPVDEPTLVEFLTARYDEYEAKAKAAGGGTWVAERPGYGSYAVSEDGDPVVYDEGSPTEEQAAHIALNDPAYVLDDIAAKRQILDLWEDPATVETLPEGVHDGRDPDERDVQVATAYAIDQVVRLLVAPFHAHPDYDTSWAVETTKPAPRLP